MSYETSSQIHCQTSLASSILKLCCHRGQISSHLPSRAPLRLALWTRHWDLGKPKTSNLTRDSYFADSVSSCADSLHSRAEGASPHYTWHPVCFALARGLSFQCCLGQGASRASWSWMVPWLGSICLSMKAQGYQYAHSLDDFRPCFELSSCSSPSMLVLLVSANGPIYMNYIN